jgi:hypothetical protein
MKRFTTLLFGLLVAVAVAYAAPKEKEKIPILVTIELNDQFVDAIVDMVNLDVQADIEVTDVNLEFESPVKDAEKIEVTADEGLPSRGHRQIHDYGSNTFNSKHTPKGLLDKNWCRDKANPDTSFSMRYPLIE